MNRIAVVLVFGCSRVPTPAAPTPPPRAVATAAAPTSDPQSFELKVRADFFDGMRGDSGALERAIRAPSATAAARLR
jgi:hypothetical protein